MSTGAPAIQTDKLNKNYDGARGIIDLDLRVEALDLQVQVLLDRGRHGIVDAHPPDRALRRRRSSRCLGVDRRQPKTGHYRRHEAGGYHRPGAKTLVKTHHTATPIEDFCGSETEVSAKAVPPAYSPVLHHRRHGAIKGSVNGGRYTTV